MKKFFKPTIAKLILALAIFSILPVNSYLVQAVCETCIPPYGCNCPESYTIHISLLSAILHWKFRFLKNIDFDIATAAGLTSAYLLSIAIIFLWKKIPAKKIQAVKEVLKVSKWKLIISGLGWLSLFAMETDFVEIGLFPFTLVTFIVFFKINIIFVHVFSALQSFPFYISWDINLNSAFYPRDGGFIFIIFLIIVQWYLLSCLILFSVKKILRRKSVTN